MSSINALLASSGLPTEEKRVEVLPDGARLVYLHAGDLYASKQPSQVVTILGSCVAICLWDRLMHVGAINHYMLPGDGGNTPSLRYSNYSVDELLRRVTELGGERRRLEAKLFGGACVLAPSTGRDLGSKNIAAARERLAQERIRVVAEDVGGNHGRKLIYRTWDGTALVKQV